MWMNEVPTNPTISNQDPGQIPHIPFSYDESISEAGKQTTHTPHWLHLLTTLQMITRAEIEINLSKK